MRKRPLCLAAVLLVLTIWILPKDVWYEIPDIPSGEKVTITGTVTKREQKEDKIQKQKKSQQRKIDYMHKKRLIFRSTSRAQDKTRTCTS